MERETPPALSLVTVVYHREIDQLRLQARSLARFATGLGFGEILVIVNNADEDAVAARVEALRPDYGALAPLLRVVPGSALLDSARSGPGLRRRLRGLWTGGLVPALRRRGGWRGHNGWQMQQAMKLMAGREAACPYILLLDAKNILVAPLERSDVIADDGRPRTVYMEPNRFHRRWYPASARILGVPDRPLPATLTNFTTPYCITRAHLGGVVDRIEARGWPVAAIFCRPRNRVTEFMLISVYSHMQPGGIEAAFAPDMLRSYTVFSSHSGDLTESVLTDALDQNGKMIGLHSHQVAALEPRHKRRIEALVLRHGLCDTSEEFWRFFPDLLQRNLTLSKE